MPPRLKYGQLAPKGLERMTALEHYLNRDAGLPALLRELVRLLASTLNGCEYCVRVHTAELRKLNQPEERIAELAGWRSSMLYTEPERAALDWTVALTNIQQGHAPDPVYDKLREHFSEVEIVNLTLTITTINAWNRLAIALGNHSQRG